MSAIVKKLLKEKFLIFLALLWLGLEFLGAVKLQQTSQLVDWRTVGTLFGLLILSRAVEQSGYLQWLGHRLIKRLRTERQVAFFFVMASAILATVITNDISLFIVIPLALEVAGRLKAYPLGRLVIFLALAVNIGSSLTAIGNPQNIILWQTSHVKLWNFSLVMFPLVSVLLLILLAAVWTAFSNQPLILGEDRETTNMKGRLLASALVFYPLFLIAVDCGFLFSALVTVVFVFMVIEKNVFRHVDWVLLMIFVLMFIDFKSVAELPIVHKLAVRSLGWHFGAYTSGILYSQVLSNVPATILLQSFHPQWQELAWGVAVGGFGVAIGSLANLIALRLARVKNIWLEFHAWSLGMLIIAYLVGQLLLMKI